MGNQKSSIFQPMRYRTLFFLISFVVIIPGVYSLLTHGLKLLARQFSILVAIEAIKEPVDIQAPFSKPVLTSSRGLVSLTYAPTAGVSITSLRLLHPFAELFHALSLLSAELIQFGQLFFVEHIADRCHSGCSLNGLIRDGVA